MKQILKRIFATFLGALLSFGMALPVFAGDEGATGGKFTVGIIVGVILSEMVIALTIVQKIRKNKRDE